MSSDEEWTAEWTYRDACRYARRMYRRRIRHEQEEAEYHAREAARGALSLLYVRVDRQMAVGRRAAWAIAAARALEPCVLGLILEFVQE